MVDSRCAFILALQAVMIAGLLLQRTRRHRAEAALQRNREELAHVTRVSTVGELTTSVAHELNQPLGAILSNADAAEMLLTAEPPALNEVREILADIRTDDQRASEVIRGMRGLLRRREIERESMELNDAVEEVLRLLNIDAALAKWLSSSSRRKTCLCLERPGKVATSDLEPGAECHRSDGRASRRTAPCRCPQHSERYETITISVSDAGCGIPPDKLAKLFEPFFTTKEEGMGMGLSIARTIVEAHQGRIWAENNPNAGATFCFTIPVSVEGRGSRVE